jgi:Ser/Thr protein kinase RdoA (MazF antagonist)
LATHESDLFLRLTPDWVIRAVEAGGFEPTGHCLALNCLENRVYDLRLEDESHVVVKFYRPGRWTKEAILEEHRFLFELADAEIPVCAPVRFADGESLHQVEGINYAVWPRTGGRSPDEFTDEQVQIIGRLVARIHNVGAAKKARHRRLLDSATYAREPLEFLSAQGFMPPQFAKRYRDAVLRIADIYDQRIKGVPFLRIHADCHLGNLLHRSSGPQIRQSRPSPLGQGPEALQGSWFFLDFDDFLTGPAVQDVWMLVPGRDAEAARQRQLFVEAYRQFRDFEVRWLDLVEPLRALRFIHYAAWIARRWKDPAFPRAFPHFNTEEYWEKEMFDLEQQLRNILAPPD